MLSCCMQVFKGEWKMPVAIKKMRGSAQHKELLEFVREGEMMRGLSHPCIVKLLGVYQVRFVKTMHISKLV